MKTIKLFSITCACLAFGLASCNNPNQENPDKKISFTPNQDSVSLQKISDRDTASLGRSTSSNTVTPKEAAEDTPHTLN
jgi:hypothetical protein